MSLPARDALAPVIRGLPQASPRVTEVPIDELIPEAADSLTDAVRQWRGWLAGRQAGLVAIAEPVHASTGPATGSLSLPRKPASSRATVVAVMFGTPAGVVLRPASTCVWWARQRLTCRSSRGT